MCRKFAILIFFVLSCTYDNIYCPKCSSYQSPFFTIKNFNINDDTAGFSLIVILEPNDTNYYLNYFRHRIFGNEWTLWIRPVKYNYNIMYYGKLFSDLYKLHVQTCYDTLNGEVFDTTLTFFIKNGKDY